MHLKIRTFAIVLISLFTIMACNEAKDPKLAEAAQLHNEATQMQAGIEQQIEGIDSLKNILTEKRKTLTDAAALARIDSTTAALTSVAVSMEEWENNLIEVPGMAHEHHEGEHHHHEHKKAPDMSADQMLQVQKEIKKGIEKIRDDLTKAEEMLQKTMKQ